MKNYSNVNYKSIVIPILIVGTILVSSFKVKSQVESSLKGNGTILKQERKVTVFNAIDASNAITIIINQDSVSSVYVETDENLLPLIITKVEGKKLIIKNKDSKSLRPTKNINVYISTADIKDIDISGAVTVKSAKKLKLHDLKLDISGAGTIDLNLSANNLNIDCSGNSNILISGNATNASAETSGASEINAFGLSVDSFKINSSGAGSAKVNVSKKLDVDISGASTVEYKGNPELKQDISGVGSIHKME